MIRSAKAREFLLFYASEVFSLGEKSGRAPLGYAPAAQHVCIRHKPCTPCKGAQRRPDVGIQF